MYLSKYSLTCHKFEEDALSHVEGVLAFSFEWAARLLFEAAASRNSAYIPCEAVRKMLYRETLVVLLIL